MMTGDVSRTIELPQTEVGPHGNRSNVRQYHGSDSNAFLIGPRANFSKLQMFSVSERRSKDRP